MTERNEQGYYRNKIDHADLYRDMTAAYQPYITEAILTQLRHKWPTQGNEALNNSVNAYAPKGRTYSLTASLDTRVAIVGGVQVVGYYYFWKKVFNALDLDMDANLRKHLQAKDKKKKGKSTRQKSKEGKKKRAETKYVKLNTSQAELIEQH